MQTNPTMYYEPDTIWGRTVQGEQEVAAAQSGLSLGQRRLLTLLDAPRTFASLAAKHHLEVTRLEQELIRLAQLRLVAYQRPGRRTAAHRPAVLVGFARSTRTSRASRFRRGRCAPGAIALGIGLVLLVCVARAEAAVGTRSIG